MKKMKIQRDMFNRILLLGTLILSINSQAASYDLPTYEGKLISVKATTNGAADEQDGLAQPDNAPKRKPYTLRPGDRLTLELSNPGYQFKNELIIDNQGTVKPNLLDWVSLEKMTVEDAENLLKQKYEEEYFKNPRISLRLVEKAKMRFKILGQVAQPGYYEVPPSLELDLLDAIAVAGGYTRLASKITYKYQEKDGDKVVENIKTYSIKDLRRASNQKIPQLTGDDTIIVGESLF